ncbi:hypothetical protein [Neobacillus jeddahensis]|uniref:hypothetical protein n=1 Tax=Neobacillus jeddahensis TaxID=1461580 RepID=UPI00058C2CE7|nr:hypothetical protein [Neobacillus jeddahensis]
MNKGINLPTEVSIKDKKQVEKGNVRRAAIFARSKVIEVQTETAECYYLLYYKNSLIYGAKLGKVVEGTFIHKALNEGIIIESPHPLLTALHPHGSITIPNKNKLFSQLQLHYSLQELAYITTTLDSFFEKDQLISIIDKVFFHFRRSGKFMKSYQILLLLNDFSPSLKSVQERMGSREFHSYRDFYQSDLPSILTKDPLFVERHCFHHRAQPEKRLLLADILSKQDSLVSLLLWLENADQQQSSDTITQYTDLALQFVTMEEWIYVLGQMKINPVRVLPDTKKVLEKMLQNGEHEKAALCLFHFIADLPSSYDPLLETIWDHSSCEFILSHLDEFVPFLQHLPHPESTRKEEEKIYQLAVRLLEEHGVLVVHEKLRSISKLFPHSQVIRKINEMIKLVENPDKMMELGDYYAEFKQFDKAIDCFFWEMELQPQNPFPVRKISKMYQYKGLAKEAAAYQKIYDQLKRNQETG